MTMADWFLFSSIVTLAVAMFLGGYAFWHWLNQHQALEFKRQDDHHQDSTERLEEHELRAIAREERAIDRHTHTIKMMQANEAITRQAVAQRIRVEEEVVKINAKLVAIGNRLDNLEKVNGDES